jgi:outer membrane autotransporter protein
MGWRTENNNLAKRMGELRNAGGEAGMWLRSYRGRQEATVGGRATNQQYTALQGGWDKKTAGADGTLFTGWTIGYLEGNSTYSRGTGDASSFSAGVYRSWLGSKGHYTDIIAKVGRVSNSYTNYLNDAGNTRVDGSFRSWGASLSAEYGYRRQLAGGWYFEPQAEVNYSRLNGAGYTTSDGTSIRNDAVNSLVGRLGLAVGRDTGKVHYYGKVSLAREFAAKAGITAASGGLAPVGTRHDLKESWLEFALGLSGKLGQRTDGYLEVTRTTGDKAKTPWQVNVGARWSF